MIKINILIIFQRFSFEYIWTFLNLNIMKSAYYHEKNKQGMDKMIKSNGAWVVEENEYAYGGTVDKKTVNEQELSLKNQRVEFWEKHHSIPTTSDLIYQELEAGK